MTSVPLLAEFLVKFVLKGSRASSLNYDGDVFLQKIHKKTSWLLMLQILILS